MDSLSLKGIEKGFQIPAMLQCDARKVLEDLIGGSVKDNLGPVSCLPQYFFFNSKFHYTEYDISGRIRPPLGLSDRWIHSILISVNAGRSRRSLNRLVTVEASCSFFHRFRETSDL